MSQDLALRASGVFLVMVVVVFERSSLCFEKYVPRDFNCFTVPGLDLLHWEFQMSKISSRFKSPEAALYSGQWILGTRSSNQLHRVLPTLEGNSAFRLPYRSHFFPKYYSIFISHEFFITAINLSIFLCFYISAY